MKYSCEGMMLGDVVFMIETLAYTHQCILESVSSVGSADCSGMAGALVMEQIDECCRWIEEHDEHVRESHAEEISKYQKALAEAVAPNQPGQDPED